ncbi:PilZ domain-containing protein [Sphingomonas piscis]
MTDDDSRRTSRVALTLNAAARQPGRGKFPVRLVDISPHGCRIELFSSLSVGSHLWLSIASLEAKQARIVWCKGDFAGLQFDEPLNECVLATLLTQHGPTKSITEDLRSLATRLKHQSSRLVDADSDLLLLSRDCAVYALVHSLESVQQEVVQSSPPQLTGSLIRRVVTDQQFAPSI